MADEVTFKRVELGEGVVYEGELLNDTRFVFGKYSAPGVTYIGEFDENSDMAGMGKLILEIEDGNLVEAGMFKGRNQNGIPLLNGIGTVQMSNGYTEIGMHVDSQLHGQGISYHPDGSSYKGEFAHGRFHGKITTTKADGTSFEAEYENGKCVSVNGVGIDKILP